MAYVAHHPPYRVPALHAGWWSEAASTYRAGIDGQWVVSSVFGLLTVATSLVFLVPMAMWS